MTLRGRIRWQARECLNGAFAESPPCFASPMIALASVAGGATRGGVSTCVFITAVVRVKAETEANARQAVISSAISAPSDAEISLANQASFIEGKNASITDVDFSIDTNSIKLHEEA